MRGLRFGRETRQETDVRRMRAFGVALVAVWALACAAACPAAAQDDLAGISYIDPFPPGDVYKLQAYGDAFAEGLTTGLIESMAADTRVQVQRKHRALAGIARPDFEDDIRVEEGPPRDPVHIGVIMIGYGDRIPIRLQSNGRRVAIDSDEWRDEYGRRVDRLIKALKKQGAALYWIGLPILRRAEANEDAQRINDIVREKAYLNSIKFIDIQSQFADEAGNYTPYGPDLTGKSRLLRDSDGIIFTLAGFQKLAHFVEQEIKRDLLQARNERAIPLAGNEAEQKRIAALRPKAAEGDGGWKGTVNAVKDGKTAQQKNAGSSAAAGQVHAELEQKADNGRITLKSVSAGGREEAVTLDLPRPTIPQAVILLMTRKESTERPSHVGDALAEDVGGGLVVLNSITPTGSAGGAARRLSPSQTPYYHVLVKGERVIPKPGRADDFSWPKADAAAAESTPTTAQPIRRIPRLPKS
jgi:uncharacterized protein